MLGFAFTLVYCDTNNRQKQVVESQCGACHITPDPTFLTKEVWKNSVLPQMSLYYSWQEPSKFEYANQSFYSKKGTLPMNDKTWSAIEAYYVANSPDSVKLRPVLTLPIQDKFEEILLNKICQQPAVTALQIEENGDLFCACNNQILQVQSNFVVDTLTLISSSITHLKRKTDHQFYFLDAGQLGPHNQAKGALRLYDHKANKTTLLKDKLYRPVYLNQFGDDLLISEYGNDVGRLTQLNTTDNSTKELLKLPGSYRTYEVDIDKDGQKELIAQFSQAREGVYRFDLKINGEYAAEPLITFPSAFGFSDLDTADFNNDGYVDLVISNGDNADFSNIPKNYHGLRIYLNDQKGQFTESYFYPIYGATQIRTLDVEGDGKTDILVASFFPTDVTESLLLFTNQSTTEIAFEPTQFANANKGRWMVMQDGDIDQDGDVDVVLGSFISGPSHMKGMLLDKWMKESVDLLILRNQNR